MASTSAQVTVYPLVQLAGGGGTNGPTVTNGVAFFNISGGITGGTVVIDSSTNLTTWTPVKTNSLTGNLLSFTNSASDAPQKFYRAREQQ